LQAGLIGVEGRGIEIALDSLARGVMPVPAGIDGEHLVAIREDLARALENEPDGPASRRALEAVGFDAETGRDGFRLEWRRKVDGGPWRERKANATLRSMAPLWRAVEDLMTPAGPERSGRLTLGVNDDGARVIRITGRREIGEKWRVPTLIIDAVLDIELARPHWPTAEGKGEFRVRSGDQRIRQAAFRSFSKAMLAPPRTEAGDDQAKAKARRKVRALILRRGRELGGRTLVVGNLAIVEAMDLPPHIERANFNAVAGRDRWKDVRKAAAYRMKRNGQGVERIRAEADRHPDPTAERIRARICEGEIAQAIGRGRGVRRGPEDPLEVLVLTDAVLAEPVDELLTDADLTVTPADLMLAEGGIAFEDGGAAAKAYPQLWPNQMAAKKALQRGIRGTNPYKKLSIWKCPLDIVFRRKGAHFHLERATYDPRLVSNPRAALEKLVGQFEILEAAPEIEASRASHLEAVIDLGLYRLRGSDCQMTLTRRPGPSPPRQPGVVINWEATRLRAEDCLMTRSEVAKAAGVSPSHLRNCETGRRKATPKLAADLEEVLTKAPVRQGRLL
jgi:putative DNA primase/helicase